MPFGLTRSAWQEGDATQQVLDRWNSSEIAEPVDSLPAGSREAFLALALPLKRTIHQR